MKKFLLLILMPLGSVSYAQPPAGYYNTATGLSGTALQIALHNIIDDHNVISYNGLWTAFQSTDRLPDGKVWDMYSNCSWTFFSDQCGNYNSECDCYNREHSWPKSWFGDQSPMNSDLFHLYPTDGWVNNKRSNYPFGEVSSPSYTSSNGSKLGNNTYPGYSGIVFEPIDEYKGDFARTYFYMSVRYYGEDNNWPGSEMTNGAQLRPWAMAMMKEWHYSDPVSEKEINRNNAVYTFQLNRNPFIDVPEFVAQIWGGTTGIDDHDTYRNITVYPLPAVSTCTIEHSGFYSENVTLSISDLSGRLVSGKYTTTSTTVMLDTETLSKGYYIISLSEAGKNPAFVKIIK
ncbi:MAG: endonuclease [Lentimicrobium sp.]|nr:endonuclease [Lentimicrobium sp.]